MDENLRFFEKSYYRDAKGRVSVLINIEKFMDKVEYIELLVVTPGTDDKLPVCKIQVVTFTEMVSMVDKGLLVEFYPERFSSDAVWELRKQDDEYIKTLKRLRDGRI